MRPTPPELGRIRLDPMSYEELRQQVQHRDGLRCQSCGSMWNLEVHHRQFRSQSAADSEDNLINAVQRHVQRLPLDLACQALLD
jgi:hypothetical protein